DVTFPLFAMLHVKGAEQHPLYLALTGKDSPSPRDIKWNFGKFLIGKNGQIDSSGPRCEVSRLRIFRHADFTLHCFSPTLKSAFRYPKRLWPKSSTSP